MNLKTLTPSMSALLAFEASARHASFTRASEELNLSQSAVSRQVQTLEELLGVTLFDRIGRHVVLSGAGRIYSLELANALATIRNATTQLISTRNGRGVLHLALLPAFGTKWLLPRLQDFYLNHPDILIHIHSRVGPVDFNGTGIDAAICVGTGNWAGVDCYELFPEHLVPVVSGTYLYSTSLLSPTDLISEQLLQITARPYLWLDWFKAQDVGSAKLKLGPQFELISHLIQAVCAGIGVGLVPRYLIEDELASGALKIPFETSLFGGVSYYFLIPPHKSACPPMVEFRDWFLGQL
jgi:DNA-binding transcriptional LysR family regulator